MLILYALFLLIFGIYSYSLIDLNLTLINHPIWNNFRGWIIQLGYFHRDISWNIYLTLLAVGFGFYFIFIKNYKKYNPFVIAIITGAILVFSYPFLSHDLFNYLFDAKILTYYHQSPYLMKALNFPNDPWIRFMHWTHRTYPYGPSFLLLTLIPSFFSFGKFILSFLFYKLLAVSLYVLTAFVLSKLNKQWAIIYATNPLIIIEGLMNGHNDMIALSLALSGIFYLSHNKKIISKILFIFSGGIKYVTLPIIGLTKKSWTNKIIFVFILITLGYMGIKMEIQPWYYLTLFIFIPFYSGLIIDLNLFFAGLLLSYYPYIRLGGWDTVAKVTIKHQIIAIFFFLNIIYLFIKYLWKIYLSRTRLR